MRSHWQYIGQILGGIAGERLSRRMDRPVSRNTLLRLVRQIPRHQRPTPRVLGVDDWAKAKGQTYGTILVDLETSSIVELLPDREAQTLADWLGAHAGVEVIARDRGGAYADGARRGAPDALQIADRFHLVHNLVDVLQHVFEKHRTLMKMPSNRAEAAPTNDRSAASVKANESEEAVMLEASDHLEVVPALTEKGQYRRAHYEQARALDEQGWTRSAIARHLGIRRHTVLRYIEAECFPDRRHATTKLDPYKAYLLERWNAGCRTGKLLIQEIRQQGYRGGRSTAYRYITRLRQSQGLPPRSRMFTPSDALSDSHVNRLTPRQAAFLVLLRPDKLREKDRQLLDHIQQAHADFAEALSLGTEYLRLIREKVVEAFDPWLKRAGESTLPAFRRFAQSLRRDYEAVKAALVYEWSTGPVEGHINKLKLIKRQMYGRAKLDLLSQRMLQAA